MWLTAIDRDPNPPITYYREQSRQHDHGKMADFRRDVISLAGASSSNNQITFRENVTREPQGPNTQLI